MAERLPGLIDPNLPPDQQPLHDSCNPTRQPGRRRRCIRTVHAGTGATAGAEADAGDAGMPAANSSHPAAAQTGHASPQPGASSPASQRPGGIHSHVLSLAPTSAAIWKFTAIRCWSTHWCRWPRWCCRPGCRACWAAMPGSILPLVVTVYFALGRRSPIQGTLMGAGMGLFEDALTHHAIGVNGIAKTVVGFLAASVGVRIDVENHTIRLLLISALPALQRDLLFVYRFLLGLDLEWSWCTELFKAVGNSVIALVLFPLLDRLQIKD